MPAKGQFILRPMANPPLKAGDYTLSGQVTLERKVPDPAQPSAPPLMQSLGDVQRQETHIRVTSPRYRLPPDQLLSAFPPANSVGAYENRLPQIVIKRRTLPWEREPAPGVTDTPWLALVVIAEGEGTLSGEQPIAQCVTAGVTLAGPNDVATAVCLSVTQDVVNKVFPKKEELALLAHVREVDVNDTELANGDDDGFLGVVVANRLPQYDRTRNKPVRYLAALINVEGQLENLAKPPPPVLHFSATAMVYDFKQEPAYAIAADPDRLVMGGSHHAALGVAMMPLMGAPQRAAHGAAPRAALGSAPGGAVDREPVARSTPPVQSGGAKGQAAQWQTTTAHIETIALTSSQNEAGRLVRDGMLEGYRGNLAQLVPLLPGLQVLKFPVLAHWSFTVDGVGGFESLMLDLKVDLLGTDPALPVPGAPPKAPSNEPPTRPPVEVAPTGHVGLPHLTRHGDKVRAWFRGPLTPFPTQRDKPDSAGHLPLAHVSDQLRRSIPDGREDLSLAAAFEIGRLTALSQPSVVRALMVWRGEQFGAARARTFTDTLKDSSVLKGLIGRTPVGGKQGSLADMLSRHLVMSAAADPARVLAPTRPLTVPGRELPYARDGGLDRLISEGFGFSAAQVKQMRQAEGTVAALSATAVPLKTTRQDAPLVEGPHAQRMHAGLDAAVSRIARAADGGFLPGLRGAAPTGKAGTASADNKAGKGRKGATPANRAASDPPVAPRPRDALDDLIDGATRARRR